MRFFYSATEFIELQQRDLSLLQGLFESRIMTSRHVSILYFDGKEEMAKKRLQKLKAAGLVGDRVRAVNAPRLLFLARKGVALLRQGGFLERYPPLEASSIEKRTRVSELTLQHEIEVLDVKSAFQAAARRSGTYRILEFGTWPLLYAFAVNRPGHGKPVGISPDGFLRIEEQERDGSLSEHSPMFLEVDRSSESQTTLVRKIAAYLEFYRSGEFAVRNGGTRAEVKEFPFRVLVVFKTAERMNNAAESLLTNSPPISTMPWLTTLGQVLENPFGPIWLRPLEYKTATAGTAFEMSVPRTSKIYARQVAREQFLERELTKIPLFE